MPKRMLWRKKAKILDETKRLQAELEMAQQKADELEKRVSEMYASAWKRKLNGQVFIATRGAQSYKFGAVTVGTFSRGAIDIIISGCRDFANSMIRLEGEWQKADEEERAAEGGSQQLTSLPNAFPELGKLTSGALYYASLPLPLATIETDADGKFQIEVPTKGEFVVAANARRDIGNGVEHYYWLVPVTEKHRSEQQLLLSNNNFTSGPSSESLIHTIEKASVKSETSNY